jgi:hypothetical protein
MKKNILDYKSFSLDDFKLENQQTKIEEEKLKKEKKFAELERLQFFTLKTNPNRNDDNKPNNNNNSKLKQEKKVDQEVERIRKMYDFDDEMSLFSTKYKPKTKSERTNNNRLEIEEYKLKEKQINKH